MLYKTSISDLPMTFVLSEDTQKDDDDNLSALLTGWSLNNREVAWLWLSLVGREGERLDDCQFNSPTMRDKIARTLKDSRSLKREIEHARETQLLPLEAFGWIEKNGRQPKWLAAEAMRKTNLRLRNSIFRTLPNKDQVIVLFDLWNTEFSRKERALRYLSEDWNEHLRTDKIFKWFKDQDEREKCSLAWSWLEQNQPTLIRLEKPFTRHGELLEFFDHCSASSGEKELYVEKIKRRWSTQKTRVNATHKKQYNFVLNNNINAALDKLAEEHQLSRTKILEELILSETAHRLYLVTR